MQNVNSFVSKTNSKYIMYECNGYCGGWADRLKGKRKKISITNMVVFLKAE